MSNAKFSYLDRDLLEAEGKVDKTTSRELPTSVGLRFGWIFLTHEVQGKPRSSLIFSYNREGGFKEADKLSFCEPAKGLEGFPALESCQDLAGAAPTAADSDLVSVEYRRAFSTRMGFALRGFYRDSNSKPDDFGFEVPLYFLSNKEGDFQGGVTFGWRDQADDITLAVFVGRKFNLW